MFTFVRGITRARETIGHMEEQMTAAVGDMRNLGGINCKMINGECEPKVLARDLEAQGRLLLDLILEELVKLGEH